MRTWIIFLMSIWAISSAFAECKFDRIKKNFHHGTTIILSQNIPWEIDPKYRGDSTLWLRGDSVVVCSTGRIIHLFYGDIVGARRVR